jgi:SAM-dependent methyltransferase
MSGDPQYGYVIDLLRRFAPPSGVVLDYGCGAGQVVRAALDAGLDAHGVDVFYGGGALREAAARTGLLGSRIHELEGDRIPLATASVDVVVANMVFEHIDAFEPALAEIDRVLRPGGVFLNLFPSDAVWREGHVGLPFVHRFPKRDFGARLVYAMVLRALGLGFNKGDKPVRQWAREAIDWLDRWTHYKSLAEIERTFARTFDVSRIDGDFLVGRLHRHARLRSLAPLLASSRWSGVRGFVASRLATHVFVLRKRGASDQCSCHAQNASTFHNR